MRVVSLCSGYEGIGIGLESLFPVDLLAVADIDPGASKILAARFPGIPNLGDLAKIDWEVMSGELAVDLLTAGFPLGRARTFPQLAPVRACGPETGPESGTRSPAQSASCGRPLSCWRT
jgi:hypothetical protein